MQLETLLALSLKQQSHLVTKVSQNSNIHHFHARLHILGARGLSKETQMFEKFYSLQALITCISMCYPHCILFFEMAASYQAPPRNFSGGRFRLVNKVVSHPSSSPLGSIRFGCSVYDLFLCQAAYLLCIVSTTLKLCIHFHCITYHKMYPINPCIYSDERKQ
ncbi:hypothetical protein VPH35_038446 [Triticum aestivum]